MTGNETAALIGISLGACRSRGWGGFGLIGLRNSALQVERAALAFERNYLDAKNKIRLVNQTSVFPYLPVACRTPRGAIRFGCGFEAIAGSVVGA